MLVLVHLLMLAKAHIAWDKYELPMLVCLWFLVADEARWPNADRTRAVAVRS